MLNKQTRLKDPTPHLVLLNGRASVFQTRTAAYSFLAKHAELTADDRRRALRYVEGKTDRVEVRNGKRGYDALLEHCEELSGCLS